MSDIIIAAFVGAVVALAFDFAFWMAVAKADDHWKEQKRNANEAKRLRHQIRNGRTPRGL